MPLPDKKSNVVTDFKKELILLSGIQKIGKTQICGALPGKNLFLAAEKGTKKTEGYVVEIDSWAKYLTTIEEFRKSDFDMAFIDTVPALYGHWLQHFLDANTITHENDKKWGVGYDMLGRGYAAEMNKLQFIGKGIILITHTKMEDVNGTKKMVPIIPASRGDVISEAIRSMVDYSFFMTSEKTMVNNKLIDARVIKTAPSDYYEAGGRTFLEPSIILPEGDPIASAIFLFDEMPLNLMDGFTMRFHSCVESSMT